MTVNKTITTKKKNRINYFGTSWNFFIDLKNVLMNRSTWRITINVAGERVRVHDARPDLSDRDDPEPAQICKKITFDFARSRCRA